MEQTSLRGIANKAANDKAYRFRNLFGLLTCGFLYGCWSFINKKSAPGVDRVDALAYQEDLIDNISQLVDSVKEGRYRAKLILRKYIPKQGGQMRPLGLPTIGDKLLQLAVARILEAIYEQDFRPCSYGYRRGISAHDAIKDLTAAMETGQYHYIVEADIKGFFDHIDHDQLLDMLATRIDDKPFLNLIRKWLKAGILNADGQVITPHTGTPQGGIVSPILANVYLHQVIDKWFEETVQTHCRGRASLCRYADDFVCAFQYEADAQRFYKVLGQRLASFGLQIAEDKTNLIRFSRCDLKAKTSFEFLGFEFRWGLSRRRKPIIKRRTSRKKYRASLASFKEWLRDNCSLPKKILFGKLNRKLRGYYNYYGVRGNYKSLSTFFYHMTHLLFKWLNRRSQRKSYNWKGMNDMIKHFEICKPKITQAF